MSSPKLVHPEDSAVLESISSRFWSSLDALVANAQIVIDRPAGTAHPRYPTFVYPYDYGYLEGTTAVDGGAIDVWIGGLGTGLVTGVVCTVDLHKRDAELKILIGCTRDEMRAIEAVHNAKSQSGRLIERP